MFHRNARRSATARTLVYTTLLTIAACGGGKRGDTYAKGTQVQEACCEHASGDTRSACLSHIVRAPDATVASAAPTQATYACVVDHFACDASTGHATKDSAQAQLECIQDLH